jgi:hypothetical protein
MQRRTRVFSILMFIGVGLFACVPFGAAHGAARRTATDHFAFAFREPVKASDRSTSQPISVTITAYKSNGAVDQAFSEKGTLSCETTTVTSQFILGTSNASVTCPLASTSERFTLKVTALDGTTMTASSGPFAVFGSLDHFNVDAPVRVPLAGTFTVTITAVDSVGHVLTGYTLPSADMTWYPGGIFPANPISIVHGVSSTSAKIQTMSTGVQITVYGPDRKYEKGESKPIAVVGPPASLVMSKIPNTTVGHAVLVSVLAYDSAGNPSVFYTSSTQPKLSDTTNTLSTPEIGTFASGVSTTPATVGTASTADKIHFTFTLGSRTMQVDSNTFVVNP